MNRKHTTCLLATAVAAVLALPFYKKANDASATAGKTTGSSISTASKQSAESRSSNSIPSKGEHGAVRPFLAGVNDFKDLNAKVAEAGPANADALKVKAVGLLLCQQSDSELEEALARRMNKGNASPNSGTSLAAFKAYRRRFCVGLDGESVGRTISDLSAADPSGDYIVSTTLTEDTDQERARAMARTIMETSSSSEAIKNAALYLTVAQDGGWDFGKEAIQGTYLSSQLPQIQVMAANMVACDLSGGCGPDGMYSWAACLNDGICHPGVSMEEIWKRTNSPDVIDAATKIADMLRRKRA